MSGSKPFDFGSFIPGFDFLQQLASSAGAAPKSGPALQNWVAPTVDVEILEKRIRELKTVQFWLEQNLVALKATVQALEVQRMTLSTLHSMNMNMADVGKAFTLPSVPEASATEGELETPPMLWPFQTVQAEAPAEEEDDADEAQAEDNKGGTADVMQWWAALAQQFQQIASQSLSEAARQIPAAMENLMSEPMAAPVARKAAARKTARKTTVASKKTAATKSAASKSAASKKAPAKKAAAKKTNARKSAAKKAATKKTAGKKTTARKKSSVGGWPLPPVFKT